MTDKEKLREERIKSASLKTDLLVASCTLLGQAWPKTTETQGMSVNAYFSQNSVHTVNSLQLK